MEATSVATGGAVDVEGGTGAGAGAEPGTEVGAGTEVDVEVGLDGGVGAGVETDAEAVGDSARELRAVGRMASSRGGERDSCLMDFLGREGWPSAGTAAAADRPEDMKTGVARRSRGVEAE